MTHAKTFLAILLLAILAAAKPIPGTILSGFACWQGAKIPEEEPKPTQDEPETSAGQSNEAQPADTDFFMISTYSS